VTGSFQVEATNEKYKLEYISSCKLSVV
jgi:hypothetical protein